MVFRTGFGRIRPLAATVTVALAGSLIAGCSLFDRSPDPAEAADRLATGLAALDLGDVSFVGAGSAEATDRLRTVTEALADTPRAVTVGEVVRDADDESRATAQLDWSWDVSGTGPDWTYRSTAALELDDEDTWRVVWTPTLVEPDLNDTERLRVTTGQGPRGEITGADGVVLMGLRDVYRVGIDKARVSAAEAETSAAALARLMGIDEAAYVLTVRASGERQFVVGITLRDDDARIVGRFDEIQAIPGGAAIPDEAVLAPTPSFAREILGSVGPVTAELIEESGGRLNVGDQVGLSGMQRRYDAYLAGVPGLAVKAVGTDTAGATTSRVLFSREPVPGKPIATTLDMDAQTTAEAVLDGVTGTAAALVAIRPSTGEVLAAADGPGANGLPLSMVNRAAPGSTFKVVTTLALLRAGLTPDTLVPCTPTVTVDGKVFKNYSNYPAGMLGQIPLRSALAQSCNTAFIAQHEQVTLDDLADAAAALGMGEDFQFGSPSFFGSVPREDTTTTKTEHAASMIGQGRVEASALAMATVLASVVHGNTVTPKLIEWAPGMTTTDWSGPTDESDDSASSADTSSSTTPPQPTDSIDTADPGESAQPSESGQTTATPRPTAAALPTIPAAPSRPLTAAEATDLRSMLAGVVSDGSGQLLAGLGVDGAKTGTAEYGSESPSQTHAWMIASRGDLAVAVFVDDGESGSATAGPLVKAFLEAYSG